MIMYAVTTIDIRNGKAPTSACCCVGIFKDLEDAEDVVLNNRADIAEGETNEFVVIEEVEVGMVYPLCMTRYWYKYDPDPSNEDEGLYWRTEEPEWASGIVNWGIG